MPRPPVLSVALASACALAYEILLVRLFSIGQWHHFAYMVISLALLGYGISGMLLAVSRHQLLRRFPHAFVLQLLGFSLAMPLCYAAAGSLAFNPEELLWDPLQWWRLAGSYLLLSLPFLFVAGAIGLGLMRYREDTGRLYGADLAGAGLGSAGVLLLLFVVFPATGLRILSLLGIIAAWIAVLETGLPRHRFHLLLAGAATLAALLPGQWIEPGMSPYKGLSQILRIPGTRVIGEYSSPLGQLTVVASERTPLRHAPGLSLQTTVNLPDQLAIFIDGDGPTVINRRDGESNSTYLDQLTWALPYHLARPERVLVLGAGGGSEVTQALLLGAERVDAVEQNPQLVALVRDEYGDFAGHLYDHERVDIQVTDARGFLAGTGRKFDLIQLPLLDSFGTSSAGLRALSEEYLYTVEALTSYLRHLNDGGHLAISRWIRLPPRDSLKLFATAIEALKRLDIATPHRHLVLIRSWQTSTLLVKPTPFTERELEQVRLFCRERGFDTSYYPGIGEQELNRYNRMAQPTLYQGASALLGPERDAFIAGYKFQLRPATDDRPYFFQFLKWSSLPEILSLRGQGGVPLLDAGYLVLLVTLLQAVLASLVLILLPLRWYRTSPGENTSSRRRGGVLVYFTALGLAFLFLEIAFIQKFLLFLHHPVYAVTAVLATFLLFAGVGSLYSQRLASRGADASGPVAAITALCLLYWFGLDHLFSLFAEQALISRMLLSLLMIAPLAFCMGIPFPLGIARLQHGSPELIPWAWGINGCASVISAVLATLLAIHQGFSAVVLMAVLLYVLAAITLPAGGRTGP